MVVEGRIVLGLFGMMTVPRNESGPRFMFKKTKIVKKIVYYLNKQPSRTTNGATLALAKTMKQYAICHVRYFWRLVKASRPVDA